ncbi:MAG: hypothetical protein PUE59_09285 [Treponema sp.]|nr:hypothetical protein [Treponema sp.]
MFEKEAEDNKPYYAQCSYNTNCKLWKSGFQQGAEFGYNKAKVEVEDSYRESLCNSELNLASITEQLEELEKANEWHFVKDGDLPEENQWVLVYDGSYTVCNYHSNTPIKWLDNYENEVYEGSIIAWKEIVTPKESE